MLDLRHLGAERIVERLPGSRELAMVYAGVDPIYEPIPVRPGAHYHMGGVETDNDGLTELTGLYAAGEVACVSVHGANRLGGNSLMETITFGRRAGRAAAEWALAHTTIEVPPTVDATPSASSRSCSTAARASGRGRSATSSALHARELRRLPPRGADARAAEIIDGLRERYERVVVEDKGEIFNSDLTQAIELGYMLDLAAVHARRRRSRGRRAAAPTRARTTTRPRRRELPQALDHALERRRARPPYKEVRMTRGEPDGAEVLPMKIGPQDLALRQRDRRARAPRVRVRRARGGDLLDCLDIVKDQDDGTLAYRKSCRMMICGSCGMRMDGAAVLACKTRM